MKRVKISSVSVSCRQNEHGTRYVIRENVALHWPGLPSSWQQW